MRVLKWTGTVGEILIIPVHPSAPIALAGIGPGQNANQFSLWIADNVMDGFDRAKTEWQRKFLVIGTGHVAPNEAVWRWSWVADPFVWHLFELTNGDF